MANEHWYMLRVRSGFETVVAQKLRKLHLEAFVPDPKSRNSQSFFEQYSSIGYVYCRFALENRLYVMSIPGVLDIVGSPKPTAVDGTLATLQTIRQI